MKVLGRMRTMLAAAVVMLATAVMGVVPQVSADEEVPKQRIQISPTRLDLEDLKPGETTTKTFKVQNTGTEKIGYTITAAPYSVEGDDYRQDFDSSSNYTDIANWIKFSQDEGELEPSTEDEITVTVDVPDDVPLGGQYAAILVKMKENSDGDGNIVMAEKQLGLIVYSSVAGQTRKEGSVVENKVPSFMFAPPISVTSVVENTGNVHADATYILQVYPFFGGEEVYTNEENPEKRTILPETRRLNTITWEGAPQLGLFKVKQTVKFLDQTSVTEKVLFICPIWFLLIVLAIIFLVIFWIVTRVRGRKD